MDLSDVQDVFFEECLEGLDVMESGLLRLDGSTDVEEINSIFRAAHSIKGGAGTFGFPDISAFTHVMETLLDEMRDGRREIERGAVDLLLKSVDVLRGMVDAAQSGGEVDQGRVSDVQGRLETLLSGEAPAPSEPATATSAAVDAAADSAPAEAPAGWKILFAPGPEMLVRGNEPLRIFRELGKLGELSVTADVSGLPRLSELEPRHCGIRWTIVLSGAAEEAAVREVFAWVEDDCELSLTPTGSVPAAGTGPQKSDAPKPAVSAPKPSRKKAAATTKSTDETAKKNPKGKDGGSIRVGIEKVDELINLVGELVITQSMLTQVSEQFETPEGGSIDLLRDGITQLERNTRELQQSVLKIRMLPITVSFSRFPRLVRDLSAQLGKKIELKMEGEQTEVDKTVLEKINDPLVHLVRNSLDHGIEMPADRAAAGKPETGTLKLTAFHEGGDIVIKVIDDGGGLKRDRILAKAIEKGIVKESEELSDERIYNLIFAPGFSTADTVSDVSGRGVGMDVVRRNIRDLGGNVTINSEPGEGSEVTIRLPLTLAILDGQLASLHDQTYVLPIVSIIESLMITSENLEAVTQEAELYRLRDQYIPIIRLDRLFGMRSSRENLVGGLLVVVESDGRRVGLLVDDLLGQQQVVIKSLETNFRQIEGISGATILGDGTIALIIDVPSLVMGYFDNMQRQASKRAAIADKVTQESE